MQGKGVCLEYHLLRLDNSGSRHPICFVCPTYRLDAIASSIMTVLYIQIIVKTKELSCERLDQFDRAHGYLTKVKQIRRNSLILLIRYRSSFNVPDLKFINKVMTGAQPPLPHSCPFSEFNKCLIVSFISSKFTASEKPRYTLKHVSRKLLLPSSRQQSSVQLHRQCGSLVGVI